MIRKLFAPLTALALLAGCVMPEPLPPPTPAAQPSTPISADAAARRFAAVVNRVEPVAESACRQMAPRAACDFAIYVDPDRSLPPNAGQTLDERGRPVIIFTSTLLADAANEDELAFILGHEAAHHIRGHIARSQEQAMLGALVFGVGAALSGAGQAGVDQATQLGAAVGSRRFSKDHELEADALGARIAYRAGYDPLRGAEYFRRIADPGNSFLGSHPPNSDRIATVQREMARIRAGL